MNMNNANMRKVIHPKDANTVLINEVSEHQLIIAKKDDIFCGIIVKENSGYIHKISCSCGCSGHFDTIEKCIRASEKHNYKFFVMNEG